MTKPKGKVEYYIKRKVDSKIVGTYPTPEKAWKVLHAMVDGAKYGVFYSTAAIKKYQRRRAS